MDKKTNNHFIWISGSINAGKTTVAKILTIKVKKSVNIELDALSSFDNNLAIDQKLNFIIEDALLLAKNWIKRGFIPILNWPVYGNELRYMQVYANDLGLNPILINLTPDKEVVKRNRGMRAVDDWEIERIDYMYEQCYINNPSFGYNIDNSALNPEETAEEIINIIDRFKIESNAN